MTITVYTTDRWISVRLTRTGVHVGDFASLEAARRYVRSRGYLNPTVRTVA